MVTRCFFPRFVLAATLALPALLLAQQDPSKKQQQVPSPENRITIIVTGGDSEKPVENASVYVKTVEDDGWKTYGHWYDLTDPKQTIKVHLDRPPKWY